GRTDSNTTPITPSTGAQRRRKPYWDVFTVSLFSHRCPRYSLSPLLERSHVGHEIVEFLVIAFPLWVFALRELRFGVHHVRLEPLRVPVGADMAQIVRFL